MTEAKDQRSKEQAQSQLAGIKELVAALEADRERLQELRDERETWVENADGDDDEQARTAEEWAKEFPDEAEELKALEAAVTIDGDELDEEQVRERIQEDPLSVEVRSDWHTPGDSDGGKPGQFTILLCTGGPACRIMGELDEHGEPYRAWLEHQDWGTPWTEYFESGAQEALLTYARCFYFGE